MISRKYTNRLCQSAFLTAQHSIQRINGCKSWLQALLTTAGIWWNFVSWFVNPRPTHMGVFEESFQKRIKPKLKFCNLNYIHHKLVYKILPSLSLFLFIPFAIRHSDSHPSINQSNRSSNTPTMHLKILLTFFFFFFTFNSVTLASIMPHTFSEQYPNMQGYSCRVDLSPKCCDMYNVCTDPAPGPEGCPAPMMIRCCPLVTTPFFFAPFVPQ